MKKRIGFIMPRLVGATLIAGVATFVITTLFKLLLGLTLVAGVVTLVIRSMSNKNKRLGYGQGETPGFGKWENFGSRHATNPIHPVAGFTAGKEATIVPID